MLRKSTFHFYGIVVWTFAILFYLYEFFLRVLPATLSLEILHDLNITLVQFSIVASAYYITYACMQIPVGILLDRFGVRVLASIACVVCAMGTFGFAFADDFYNVVIARLLIGFGSSFGFLSLLVLAFNWFPHKYFGLLSGIGQALGCTGPLIAGAPVIWMMGHMHNGWRELFVWIAGFGAILAIGMVLCIRNQPPDLRRGLHFEPRNHHLLRNLKLILKIPQVWITMVYTACIYVSLPLLGAYWGSVYLQTRGLNKEVAGAMISMIWVGLAIGSPLFGMVSDLLKRRKPVLAILGFFGAIVSCVLLFFPIQSEWGLGAILILIGMAAGGQSLAFALMVEYVPKGLRATAMGANNTAVMLFASLLPPLVTLLIQSDVGPLHLLATSDFTRGFLLMPLAFLIAGLIALFATRETFCKSSYKKG